jgi:hypothetical protein
MSKHAVYYLWQLLKLDRNAVFTQCSAAHYLHAISLFIFKFSAKIVFGFFSNISYQMMI